MHTWAGEELNQINKKIEETEKEFESTTRDTDHTMFLYGILENLYKRQAAIKTKVKEEEKLRAMIREEIERTSSNETP